MKIESSFLRSKLARRIFWLFVVCALVPITLLSLVALRTVTTQLNEGSRGQLRQATHEQAMSVCERLVILEGDLKLLASYVRGGAGRVPGASAIDPTEFASTLTKRFRGVTLITSNGNEQLLFGRKPIHAEFTEQELNFLNSGKNVLKTTPCSISRTCVLLSRRLDANQTDTGILVAEIETSFLWDAENLPSQLNLCVLDALGRTLFCSAEAPASFPAQVARTSSGEFMWKGESREYLATYWNLPLGGAFLTPHWTVVGSEDKPDVLAPLAHFRTSFLLVVLLTVWIVLLLSLVQIRRNLVPLAKLKEGTRNISLGKFNTRVSVDSEDEFQELAASFNSMAGRIEKQLNSLKTFSEIDRAILSSWDIEKIVDTVATRLGELIPLDLVSVNLFDPGGGPMVSTYIYGPGRNKRTSKGIIEATPEEVKELREHPGLFVIADDGDSRNLLKPLRARGMRYFLRVPIHLQGRPTAVVTLGHASAAVWNDEDKQHATQLADQVAVALSNSQLADKLNQLHWGALSALARAIDAKSPWTLGHSERVTECAVRIAEAMGLAPNELAIIRRGCLLHDIGKIGVSAEILDKPGKLTADELRQMRDHVNIGARILQPVPGFAEAMPIVLQHHEWINGGGYPNGLAGDEVTLHARIVAVADCYDALISDRPYRPGMPVKKVIEIISEGAGKQFDPMIVKVFQKIMEQDERRQNREVAAQPLVEVV